MSIEPGLVEEVTSLLSFCIVKEFQTLHLQPRVKQHPADQLGAGSLCEMCSEFAVATWINTFTTHSAQCHKPASFWEIQEDDWQNSGQCKMQQGGHSKS